AAPCAPPLSLHDALPIYLPIAVEAGDVRHDRRWLGRSGGGFGGEWSFADRVHGADLVVVGGAVRHCSVVVRGDVAECREQRFGAGARASVGLVVTDHGAT